MTIPYPFQIEGVNAIESFGGRSLLADEMGLGKTLQSLLWVKRHSEARPMIVICPASLKWNWRTEAAHHVGMRAEVLEGTKPHLFRCGFTRHNFVVLNYDILKYWIDFLKALKPQIIIMDEVHYLGSRSSQRTKACRELCRGVPYIIGLSGTPLTNRPAELYPTLNILRPDLFPSFWPYAHRYCSPRRTIWGWEFKGATHLGELHKLLTREVMIRRRKEDVLSELPSKRRSVIPMELSHPKDYQKAYDDFLGWITEQDTAKLSTAMRAESLVKLGYLKRMAGRLKLPAVMEWVDNFLEESDGKLVLFAIHRSVISELHNRYRDISVVVDGSVIGKKRKLAVQQFQQKRGTRLFIGNVKAAGVGLTLTAANTVAFAEIGWTPGEMTQAEDRIHRIGQKKTALCYYLVARETIEMRLVELITRKQKTLNAVLDGKGRGDRLDIIEQLTNSLLKGNQSCK